MKKVLNLLVVIFLLSVLLYGCGSAPAPAAAAPNAPAATVASAAAASKDSGGLRAEDSKDNAITGSGVEAQSVSNAILSQRKVIRNANISVEVNDFEKAYGQIKSMISADGFVQETNIKKEKVYVDSKERLVTKGTIIIRVDKDKFESTLSGIKGLGVSFDEEIKGEDVTDKFFDTESRLRLLRYEESRLEDYLKKITDPDVIFKTESRLTDIRHEIEGLTGTLQKWNDLVSLSTITINLYEKNPVSDNIPQVKSYGDRLTGGFINSIKGVAHFCGELLILVAQALPVLALIALLFFAAFWIYKKFFNRKVQKTNGNKKEENI